MIDMFYIEDYNLHWRRGFRYNFPMKRKVFEVLKRHIDSKFITILYGQRRTGKTTLFKQLIDFLIESGVKRYDVFYYSFDEGRGSIREVIREYEGRTGGSLTEGRKYIFLDEVQKLENWSSDVKYFYDFYPGLKIFLSGSSSLFIRRGSRESLAGRSIEIKLGTLEFGEFLMFKGLDGLLEDVDYHREALKFEFENFLKRPYVEIVNSAEEEIGSYVSSLLDKVIYVDIPEIFPVDEPPLLARLMAIISSRPGIYLEIQEIAKELGRSRVTISNYLSYLNESLLIHKVYSYSPNLLTSEKKKKRFYPASTAFCYRYTPGSIEISTLVETSFVLQLDARFFFRDPLQREVDIISERLIPIEIKYKDTMVPRDLRGIFAFMRKNNVGRGVLITRDVEKMEIINGKKIYFLPAWKYALRGEKLLREVKRLGQ